MSRFRSVLLFSSILVFGSILAARTYGDDSPTSPVFLHSNWRLESSCKVTAKAESISIPGFDDSKWHPAIVPGTVVGALVADKTLPEPNYGKNLNSFPGAFTDNKRQAANLDMPPDSPFRCSHWFRTEFAVPVRKFNTFAYANHWLHFLGINYRANIWLNGKQIAGRADVAGAYRAYEFSIGDLLHGEGKNALAVEIFAPEKNDLGLTWVDWNPTPPDKDTGIWREVFLTSSGDVTLRHPFANAKLDSAYKSAVLTLSAELRNTSDHAVKATFIAEAADTHLTQPVELAPKESKIIRFSPDQFSQLKLANPHLWWPYQMGEPYLYTAKFRVEISDATSDSASVPFGIREVTSELTETGGRLFKVNGKRVLIRGAAWTSDMLLRWDSHKLDADLAYVKDMGLNTIRLEGNKPDRDEFFYDTDKLGILVMTGWICCDAWEHWNKWTPETKKIAAASMIDQASRLRNHPSVFVWLYGSDGPPPADIENMYLDILKNLEWPNPTVSSASETPTKVTGKSGVKMTGPYEYVPPVYWFTDTKAGGAYGYNTETSPGPAIPTKESLAKFIPKEHLWPIDDYWNFHAGGERFTTIDVFRDALEKRYGAPTSLDDFERKSQAMTYDNQRSMYEAYARNKYVSTGVIQWMLNNAWPSLIWHLYDYYLVPAGGYFGTKKATEIVHVQYDWDTNSVSVINGKYEALKGYKVTAKLYNIDAKEAGSRDATIDLAADAATKAFDLPAPTNLSTTYFLKLQLHDASGNPVSDNFYWLSTKPDTMDWKHKKDTVYTPQKDFADLTALNSLPQVKLDVAPGFVEASQAAFSQVRIKNPSNSIAFMIHVRLFQSENGDDVTPVFWTDNYFSLLPGEEKSVSGHFNLDSARGNHVGVQIDGYNIVPQTF
ncbi:MAG TPA: glycoside hydrolase family 2 TIM barrel-domain containing protein [Candidatus Baltobacteraceae bacterium]|nr:glycoside hydrolase family 2 TIM barrel-domain containing protein [Candidatus Baltobacteraceae bacterium]